MAAKATKTKPPRLSKPSRPAKLRTAGKTAASRATGKTLRGAKPPVKKAATPSPCIIAGIGASAGGFQSAVDFLKKIPPRTNLALVLVTHLDPTHESKLAELLGKATKMPVREITDGEQVQPAHVYVLPSNFDVILEKNRTLKLTRRVRDGQPHMPVNTFFRSFATVEGSNAIGVILSGTGSDGTAGLSAIKAAGGRTFAEAEKTAK